MTCHHARELFSALVDDALVGPERTLLDAHVWTCPECQRELDRFRRTVGLLQAVEPVRAPAGFVDRVLAAARPAPWPRRLLRWLFVPLAVKLPIGVAAVAAVAVSAAYVLQRSPGLQQVARIEAPVPEPLRPAEVPRPAEAPRLTETPAPTPPATPPLAASREAPSRVAPTPSTPKVAEPAAPASRPDTPGPSGAPETAESRPLAKAPLLGAAPAPAAPGAAPSEEKAERRPTASVHRFSARALVSVDVSGRLRAKDRQAAAIGLAELVARLGGAQLARHPDSGAPAGELVELRVPRAAYPEFTAGLRSLGEWRVETEAVGLPEEIRAIVRLID